MSLDLKMRTWQIRQQALDEERQRLAYLNDLSRLPKNDLRLLEKVRVKVLGAFCVKGQRIEPGTNINIERFDAESLKAQGKVEILS